MNKRNPKLIPTLILDLTMFCSHHILLSQKFCLRFHMKRIGEEIKSSKFFYLILFWICFESRSSGETPFMLLSKWQYLRIKYDHSKRKQNSKDFFFKLLINRSCSVSGIALCLTAKDILPHSLLPNKKVHVNIQTCQ